MLASKKVLIVGGGPVGMAAALFLNRLGVKPRIIDKRASFTEYSKALAINARTLLLLRDVGATQRILREALKVKRGRLFFGQSLVAEQLIGDPPLPGNNYNHITILPQSRTEAILRGLLMERSIPIQTEITLTGIESSQNGATATISKDGKEQTSTYDYVIGTDGAKSACRKLLNIPFLGETFPQKMYISDFELKEVPHQHIAEVHAWQDKSLGILPVTRNAIRLVSNVDDYVYLLPKRFPIEKQIWRSEFTINHRVAETMQTERVFLAGDAAHIHSPLGGRGMNIGIEDVYVLTRLMSRERTQLYSATRKPIIDGLVRRTRLATEFFMGKDNGAYRRKIPYVAPALQFMASRQINQFLLGLDHEIDV